MRGDILISALTASPFRPFRVHIADGTAYDVRHPEMLMVSRHSAVIGISEKASTENGAESYPEIDRFATIDLRHVTQAEELPSR